MDNKIQIVEKPEWVSWEDIKQCLFEAHAANRGKGINMANHQWPAEKIKESIGDKGILLVALDGEKVVGTAAIIEKFGKRWYAQGRYAYMGFAGVLPAYNGYGLYRRLTEKREKIARSKGFEVLVFDTHKNNKKVQSIAKKNGYKFVRFFRAVSNDHYNVVMAKWPNGCPYSSFYCWMKYQVSKLYTIMRFPLKK